MNIKLKRKYKRLSKLCYYLAFTFIGLFFLDFILFVTNTFGLNAQKMNPVLVIVIICAPLFLTLLSWFYGMMYFNTLMLHKAKINEWRKRNIISKIIEFETTDRHKEAVDLYSSLKNGSDKDYMYMFIVVNSMHSDDPERKEKALSHFNGIRKWYDINDTILN